jgi:hypothetical protein
MNLIFELICIIWGGGGVGMDMVGCSTVMTAAWFPGHARIPIPYHL